MLHADEHGDEIKVLEKASESEAIAESVPDTNGCLVVPAFTGLGAPYWDQYARGAVLGLTRGVNRAHLVGRISEFLRFAYCLRHRACFAKHEEHMDYPRRCASAVGRRGQ